MGTAATAKQVYSLHEEGIIPKALRMVFEAFKEIRQEYTVILKVVPKS